MTLFKTTLWTGSSTFIKVISTYVLWKIVALYTGPTGMAILEQFQNFIQICRSLSGSLSQGIVKYVAEYKDNETQKAKILSSSLTFYLVISFLVTFVLIVFSKTIALKVFSSVTYQSTIIILALTIVLYTLNNLLLSALNGELEIKKYATCNVANTLINFIITVFLVIKYGIHGGVVGLSLNQSVAFLLTLYLVLKSKWFKFSLFVQGIDKESLKKLIKYATVSFVPILLIPISLIVTRRWIAHELSWEQAGYWQAIMKISDGYLILMELIMGVYFIPKLSGIKVLSEFKEEIISSYKFVIPCAFLGLSFIFLLKKQVVSILYSPEFFPMLALFKYQVIGDMARIGTWLLSNIMAAKAKIKIMVISDVTFNLLYITLMVFFVHYYGLIGTAIAFAINSILYFSSMLFFTIKCVRNGSFQLAT